MIFEIKIWSIKSNEKESIFEIEKAHIVPQSMTEFWQYLTFVFALIELYIIINVKLMTQIRYGRVVFVALLILLASLCAKPHFATISLYILGVLYLYVCILRLKFGKKSEI